MIDGIDCRNGGWGYLTVVQGGDVHFGTLVDVDRLHQVNLHCSQWPFTDLWHCICQDMDVGKAANRLTCKSEEGVPPSGYPRRHSPSPT